MTLVTANPIRVMSALNSLSRHRVQSDCAAMARSVRRWSKMDRFGDTGRLEDNDPAVVATLLHRGLCRAWVFYCRSMVPKATRLYLAASAGHKVAEVAAEAACITPGHRLAELDGQLDAIRAREQTGVDDELGGDVPADYLQAVAEYDVLYQQVLNEACAAVLRRYAMGGVGKAYRTNRSRYDELFELGRQQLFDKAPAV